MSLLNWIEISDLPHLIEKTPLRGRILPINVKDFLKISISHLINGLFLKRISQDFQMTPKFTLSSRIPLISDSISLGD